MAHMSELGSDTHSVVMHDPPPAAAEDNLELINTEIGPR